ncbi:hypothetical protein QKA_2013 [Clostridioides difficile DA00165]|nr:hypothetical protein QKA_2013 [Clostridioides difficile DA00165]
MRIYYGKINGTHRKIGCRTFRIRRHRKCNRMQNDTAI